MNPGSLEEQASDSCPRPLGVTQPLLGWFLQRQRQIEDRALCITEWLGALHMTVHHPEPGWERFSSPPLLSPPLPSLHSLSSSSLPSSPHPPHRCLSLPISCSPAPAEFINCHNQRRLFSVPQDTKHTKQNHRKLEWGVGKGEVLWQAP